VPRCMDIAKPRVRVTGLLELSVDDAFALLRRYVRTHGDHLTEVSRRLITEPEGRQTVLAAMTQMLAVPPSSRAAVRSRGGEHGRGARPPRPGVARSRRVRRFGLTDPPQPVESLLGAGRNSRFSNLEIRDRRPARPKHQIRAGRGVRFPSVTSESEFFPI
jgi:hypothetical protein